MATELVPNIGVAGEAIPTIAPHAVPLSWSYSRREAVDQCLLRYFYQYYAASISDRVLRDEVQSLRVVKNRHLRIGELLHLAIATYLKKKKIGRDLSLPWLQSWVIKLFDADQAYSRSIRSGEKRSLEQYPPTLLDEVLFDAPNRDVLLRSAAEQLTSALQRFFRDEAIRPLRILGGGSASLIEHKLSLSGYAAPVLGKLDLASCDGATAIVVDWKTGNVSEGGAESLQLATYGLWAQNTYALSADNIRIVKVHLGDGIVVDFKAGEEAFANARARIHQDLERLSILHAYGEQGTMQAFTPSASPSTCHLCSFRRACPEGKQYA